ncbi:UNVERIFIED_CONTAM: hypothetical protein FKN15_014822 [Acipenser sinensis]
MYGRHYFQNQRKPLTMKTQQNIAANSHNNITKYQTILINYNKGKGEEEFRRITTIQLESTFMEKLDCYMPRLLSLFMKKGGAAGVKLQGIQEMLYGSNTVEKGRKTVIRGLIIYLGENVEDLIKEYQILINFVPPLENKISANFTWHQTLRKLASDDSWLAVHLIRQPIYPLVY